MFATGAAAIEPVASTASGRDKSMDAEHLVAALANGDRMALGPLYDEYSRPVFALLLRIVRDSGSAEDLLQEVFTSAWQHADRFDPAKGDVLPWLLGIGHHAALNELRRRRRRPQTVEPLRQTAELDSIVDTMADPEPAPEEAAWFEIRRSDLQRAVANLGDADRTVIHLYAAGYSQSEIAERLQSPLGTVKTRMRRALKQLREAADRREFEWD